MAAEEARQGIALYARLKGDLARQIAAGEWAPGQRIPSEAELMARYGVSRITVRRALDELCAEGVLQRMQGRGTFVKKTAIENRLNKFGSFSELLRARGIEEKINLLRFETLPAGRPEAEGLNIPEGAPVFLVERLRSVDVPYAFEQSTIPCAAAPGLTGEMVRGHGLYRSLRLFGAEPDNATENLAVINLDARLAKALGRKKGEAAMRAIRIARAGARAVEYCHSVVCGDFFSYTIELR